MLRCALVAAALVSLAFDTRGAPQCVAVPPPKRMDCGHPGITKDECLTNKVRDFEVSKDVPLDRSIGVAAVWSHKFYG